MACYKGFHCDVADIIEYANGNFAQAKICVNEWGETRREAQLEKIKTIFLRMKQNVEEQRDRSQKEEEDRNTILSIELEEEGTSERIEEQVKAFI